MKTFLYSYEFRGARWELPVQADTKDEAEHRLMAIQRARYDGELVCELPLCDLKVSPVLWFLVGVATYGIIYLAVELGVW